jgi:hypothetical protein
MIQTNHKTGHQPIDTIVEKNNLISSQKAQIHYYSNLVSDQSILIEELASSKRKFKSLFIFTFIMLVLTVWFAIKEASTIRYMANDLRDQRSTNSDLKKIASYCMQENYTKTGEK